MPKDFSHHFLNSANVNDYDNDSWHYSRSFNQDSSCLSPIVMLPFLSSIPSILHPLLLSLLSHKGLLESIPTVMRRIQDYTVDKSPVHLKANEKQTTVCTQVPTHNLEGSICHTRKFLGCERKPENRTENPHRGKTCNTTERVSRPNFQPAVRRQW